MNIDERKLCDLIFKKLQKDVFPHMVKSMFGFQGMLSYTKIMEMNVLIPLKMALIQAT